MTQVGGRWMGGVRGFHINLYKPHDATWNTYQHKNIIMINTWKNMGKPWTSCSIIPYLHLTPFKKTSRYCLALCQWLMDRLYESPILPIIQLFAIGTMLNKERAVFLKVVMCKQGLILHISTSFYAISPRRFQDRLFFPWQLIHHDN